MKRFFCIILIAVLLLSGCASQAEAMTWQEQYELGVRYLSEGNYEEAVLAFSAAIEIDPKRPEAYVHLAEIYTELGEAEKYNDLIAVADDLFGEEAFMEMILGSTPENNPPVEEPDSENNPPVEAPDAEAKTLLLEFLQTLDMVSDFSASRGYVQNEFLALEAFPAMTGVLGCDLRDFDGDGTEELFVAYADDRAVSFRLYQATDSGIRCTSEVPVLTWAFDNNPMLAKYLHIYQKEYEGEWRVFYEDTATAGIVSEGAEITICGYSVENGKLVECVNEHVVVAGMPPDLVPQNQLLASMGLAPIYDAKNWQVLFDIGQRSNVEFLATIEEEYKGSRDIFGQYSKGQCQLSQIPPMELTVRTNMQGSPIA